MSSHNQEMVEEFLRRLRAGTRFDESYFVLPDFQKALRIFQADEADKTNALKKDLLRKVLQVIESCKEFSNIVEMSDSGKKGSAERLRAEYQNLGTRVVQLLRPPSAPADDGSLKQSPVQEVQTIPSSLDRRLDRRKQGTGVLGTSRKKTVRTTRPNADQWMARRGQPIGTFTPMRCTKISRDRNGVTSLHESGHWTKVSIGDADEFFRDVKAESVRESYANCTNADEKVNIPHVFIQAENGIKRWKFVGWSSKQEYLAAKKEAKREIDEEFGHV